MAKDKSPKKKPKPVKPVKTASVNPRASIPPEYQPAEWLITSPHRPPNSSTAISHRDALYAAIGRVLTAWEVLETLLAGVFQQLVGTDHRSAMRAYGSILASGSRCDMLNAAAEVELSGDALNTFLTCIDDVRRLSATRNLVAHGVVVSQEGAQWVSDDPTQQLNGPFLLMTAPYNSQKFKLKTGPSYIYSLKEVEAIGMEIMKMQSRVGALYQQGAYRIHWRFAAK